MGPKLTAQLCVALGQLHENKMGSKQDQGLDRDQDWHHHHQDKGSAEGLEQDDPSLFVSTVLRGLVIKWAPRMRAVELVETVLGIVALSKASGQGLARAGLTSTSIATATTAASALSSHNHQENKNNSAAAAAAAAFRMSPSPSASGSVSVTGNGGMSGYGGVSGGGGGVDWHSLWDGLEASAASSGNDFEDSSTGGGRGIGGTDVGNVKGQTATATTSVSGPLSSLSLALVSLTVDELARALEAMLFFGLGTGLGPGPGPGAGLKDFQGRTSGQGLDQGLVQGLLLHPRHHDLSVCLQLAAMQTWARSIDTLAHPRASPARTEAWIIRSTRLLRSLGAVCGGSDPPPTHTHTLTPLIPP